MMKTATPKIHQTSGVDTNQTRPEIRRHHVALLLLTAAACTAHAQSFSINWSKIAAGGGSSTGGTFAVSGTVGQHDASGPLTNAQYAVRGGFWTLPVAVQVSGAPTLTIVPAGPGQAKISWSPTTPGFVLQETVSLTSPSWTDAPSGVANPVTVQAVPPMKFYRLMKP